VVECRLDVRERHDAPLAGRLLDVGQARDVVAVGGRRPDLTDRAHAPVAVEEDVVAAVEVSQHVGLPGCPDVGVGERAEQLRDGGRFGGRLVAVTEGVRQVRASERGEVDAAGDVGRHTGALTPSYLDPTDPQAGY